MTFCIWVAETPPTSTVALPDNVHIASNDAGITGGIRLWDEVVWSGVLGSHAASSVH